MENRDSKRHTSIEEIDRWRAEPHECQPLEFKEAKTQFDTEKLFKYCVALANEGGGKLLLGVEDKPTRRTVGSSAFPNLIKVSENLFDTLKFRVDVESDASEAV